MTTAMLHHTRLLAAVNCIPLQLDEFQPLLSSAVPESWENQAFFGRFCFENKGKRRKPKASPSEFAGFLFLFAEPIRPIEWFGKSAAEERLSNDLLAES
jgi:hypothetical protein